MSDEVRNRKERGRGGGRDREREAIPHTYTHVYIIQEDIGGGEKGGGKNDASHPTEH